LILTLDQAVSAQVSAGWDRCKTLFGTRDYS